MSPHVHRQLRDIQVRAESLINGSPSMEDIEEFHQYNEELKNFLITNVTEDELRQRVYEIPEVLQESASQLVSRGMFSAFLMFFASGVITYFNDRQRIENAKELIREARGRYATIELFVRNL